MHGNESMIRKNQRLQYFRVKKLEAINKIKHTKIKTLQRDKGFTRIPLNPEYKPWAYRGS